MKDLRREIADYYSRWRIDHWGALPPEALAVRREILAAMDAYADAHPDCHPALLKARLHEEIAERFEPVLFPHSPFFFEMGVRFAENWGTPAAPERVVASWLLDRTRGTAANRPEWRCIAPFQVEGLGLWGIWDGFDNDHHSLGYTRLLRTGVNGLLADIDARRRQPCTGHQAANLEAMARSCRALLRAAERFGQAARQTVGADAQAQRFLGMIADTAGRIPAEPPRTFYEALAALWFLREATASFEAIGISVVGHLDRLLGPFYDADLAAGRITEAEARDLLARWMIPTDVKFHIEDSAWPETSTCMELGGCDADGRPVWNAVTRLLIEVHRAHGLANPKPNCRFSAESPAEYLHLISEATLAGHNHFALLNDDVLIPALVRAGKDTRDARLYVNGGCQEPIAEGVEHSAGAYYYFNLARVLDWSLQPAEPLPEGAPDEARAVVPGVIDADTFEAFYAGFMANLTSAMRVGATWVTALGQDQPRRHPCPLFSAGLDGCIAGGLDYTEGGAKYNPSGIAVVGFATVVDALYAVKAAIYDEGWLTPADLRAALAANWEGHAALRARLHRLPRFGQGHRDVDALAGRFVRELSAFIETLPSERGGRFQPSLFVYYAFKWFAPHTRATPDGRRHGDMLAQGVAPDRTTAGSIPSVYTSLRAIDFTALPGNAVLDMQLPARGAITTDAVAATIRAFGDAGGATLQLTCVSRADLQDAQAHPERHQGLMVRICGLSARFVCLEQATQNEIIQRADLW